MLRVTNWIIIFSCLFIVPSFAINWASEEVEDPFSNSTCMTGQIVSYGSYVYSYPSKYDAIFWPHTDRPWIWYCPESGYVSFGDDFENLTDEETAALEEALADGGASISRNPETSALLRQLEWNYTIRGKDDEFWSWFYRVMAYWHRNDDEELAAEYRSRALPLIEHQISITDPGPYLIQNLYVAGDYHRRLGDLGQAKDYFQRARQVAWTDEDGNDQVGSAFWTEIIDEREALME